MIFVLFHLETGLLEIHSNTPLPNVHCALIWHVAWKNTTQTWLFFWIIHKKDKFNLYFFNVLFLKDNRLQYVIKKYTTFTIHTKYFEFELRNKKKLFILAIVFLAYCYSIFTNSIFNYFNEIYIFIIPQCHISYRISSMQHSSVLNAVQYRSINTTIWFNNWPAVFVGIERSAISLHSCQDIAEKLQKMALNTKNESIIIMTISCKS